MIQTTSDENDPGDFLKELFGEVIFSYTDADAIADGVLIPFLSAGKDTGHRITNNAYTELKEHYAPQYPEYKDADFYKFFFNELLPLVPEAFRVYKADEILTTDFDFKVRKYDPAKSQQLWYVPNEVGGVTEMLPSDY